MGYDAKNIMKEYDSNLDYYPTQEQLIQKLPQQEVKLPPYHFDILSLRENKYLIERGFEPTTIKNQWGIKSGGIIGDYKYRIIIPIYYKGKLVSYQGRDITGKQMKYKTLKGVSIKDYLYGLDHIVGDRCVITEGVTDVWNIGKGNAVATFGINYTIKQISLLVKTIKKAIILFDDDEQAQKQAEKLKGDLEAFGIDCYNFNAKGVDAGEMEKDEIEVILNTLNKM